MKTLAAFNFFFTKYLVFYKIDRMSWKADALFQAAQAVSSGEVETGHARTAFIEPWIALHALPQTLRILQMKEGLYHNT